MMMKLAYERPVMRAEAFATNAYCDGCKKQAKWEGVLTGIVNEINYFFDVVTRRDMINQDTGLQQYYYTGTSENNDGTYFLEYCASAEKGKDFFLYKDLGEESGYCKHNGSLSHIWAHECDKSGDGTLEVAQGGEGNSGKMYSWKTNLCWYADLNLGNISYTQKIEYTQS